MVFRPHWIYNVHGPHLAIGYIYFNTSLTPLGKPISNIIENKTKYKLKQTLTIKGKALISVVCGAVLNITLNTNQNKNDSKCDINWFTRSFNVLNYLSEEYRCIGLEAVYPPCFI